MQPVSVATKRLEFGIYRDGDNNLDTSQHAVVDQARDMTRADRSIECNVLDTTAYNGGDLRTDTYRVDGGAATAMQHKNPVDMADPSTLAKFVADTLDNAQRSGAKQTWIDLVDHGAGDGGGLEADSAHGIMRMPDIAAAIAQGIALHAQEHPEDAGRTVDGIVANQCLMASMGFADALSRAGVHYLAASPETMVSPGTPSTVALDIAAHEDDPNAMARGVVNTVMNARYGLPQIGQAYGPAAAFDVLDLGKAKISAADAAIKAFNDTLPAMNAQEQRALRADVSGVQGMVRFPDATPDMPWHADRPAVALYDAIAGDTRLDATLRSDAAAASKAVGALVLAHRESSSFAPFGGSSYRDAAGPTIHAPVTAQQVDPWAPAVSETQNKFFKAVDAAKFVHAVA